MVDIIIPLMLIILVSLFIFLLTNRKFVNLSAILSLNIALLVWCNYLPQLFYIIVAIFIGISMWLSFHEVNQ